MTTSSPNVLASQANQEQFDCFGRRSVLLKSQMMFPLCPPKVAVTGADLELSSRNLFPRAQVIVRSGPLKVPPDESAKC